MRGHRCALLNGERGDVDDRGDVVVPEAEAVEGIGIGHVGQLQAPFARGDDQALQMIAVHRCFVDARRVRDLCCSMTDAMDLDVVGMSVRAVLVVDGEDVRPLVGEDRGELGCGVVDVRTCEAARVGVGRRAGHPRIDVAEELDAMRADLVGGGQGLALSPLAEGLAVREEVLGELAELAACREDQHDAVAFSGGSRERAALRDRFVVRVGVEADEGRHQGPGKKSLNAPASAPSPRT